MQRLTGTKGQWMKLSFMPAKILIAAFFSAILIYSCSKGNSGNDHQIEGKWKLTETLMDPGDGSGTWQPALIYGQPDKIYIRFNHDGTIQSDAFYLGTYDHYYTTPDHKLYMIKASVHDTAQMYYHFEESKLIINPMCIEACGFKFVRAGK